MVYRKEKYWSRYSRNYDEGADYVVGKELRIALAEKLKEERNLGEVIEFGCGTGYYTKSIAGHAARVIATDLSDEMLELARDRLKGLLNVSLQKEDCENPSFPSQRFDTVFMANVVHTIENPDKALAQSHRILKKNGHLLIVSFTDYGATWLEKMELGFRYFQKFGMPPGYYRNYSPEELAALVSNAGFGLEKIEVLGSKARALYLKGRKI